MAAAAAVAARQKARRPAAPGLPGETDTPDAKAVPAPAPTTLAPDRPAPAPTATPPSPTADAVGDASAVPDAGAPPVDPAAGEGAAGSLAPAPPAVVDEGGSAAWPRAGGTVGLGFVPAPPRPADDGPATRPLPGAADAAVAFADVVAAPRPSERTEEAADAARPPLPSRVPQAQAPIPADEPIPYEAPDLAVAEIAPLADLARSSWAADIADIADAAPAPAPPPPITESSVTTAGRPRRLRSSPARPWVPKPSPSHGSRPRRSP